MEFAKQQLASKAGNDDKKLKLTIAKLDLISNPLGETPPTTPTETCSKLKAPPVPPPLPPSGFAPPPPPPPPPPMAMGPYSPLTPKYGSSNTFFFNDSTPPPPPPPLNFHDENKYLSMVHISSSANDRTSAAYGISRINEEIERRSQLGTGQAQSAAKSALYDNLPKSSKPLKNISWQKLPPSVIGKNNLWRELNSVDNMKLDFNLLEELFVKTNPSGMTHASHFLYTHSRYNNSSLSLMNGGLESRINGCQDDLQVVHILDSKQNMNYIVYLKQIKIPLKDFIELVKNGQSKEIGLDNLSCLKKILPEKSDVDAIRSHCETTGDFNQLGKAERFIKMLTDLSHYELRIKTMHFIEEFNEIETKLSDPLEAYCKCCDVLLKSKSLKSFIRIVLATGNFLNMNSYNGKAVGFKITLLPKLIEIKTNKPSVSFMHVIVTQYEKLNEHDAFEFLAELKDLSLVVNNKIVNLDTDFKQLKNNMQEIFDQIKDNATPEDVKSQFTDTLATCNAKVNELESQFKQIDTLKNELIEYYCEDQSTFSFDDFMRLFYDFCGNINRVKEENRLRLLNEDKIAKRKQKFCEMLEKQKSQKDILTNSIKEVDENDALKSILTNMKIGRVVERRQSSKREFKYQPRPLLDVVTNTATPANNPILAATGSSALSSSSSTTSSLLPASRVAKPADPPASASSSGTAASATGSTRPVIPVISPPAFMSNPAANKNRRCRKSLLMNMNNSLRHFF